MSMRQRAQELRQVVEQARADEAAGHCTAEQAAQVINDAFARYRQRLAILPAVTSDKEVARC